MHVPRAPEQLRRRPVRDLLLFGAALHQRRDHAARHEVHGQHRLLELGQAGAGLVEGGDADGDHLHAGWRPAVRWRRKARRDGGL